MIDLVGRDGITNEPAKTYTDYLFLKIQYIK